MFNKIQEVDLNIQKQVNNLYIDFKNATGKEEVRKTSAALINYLFAPGPDKFQRIYYYLTVYILLSGSIHPTNYHFQGDYNKPNEYCAYDSTDKKVKLENMDDVANLLIELNQNKPVGAKQSITVSHQRYNGECTKTIFIDKITDPSPIIATSDNHGSVHVDGLINSFLNLFYPSSTEKLPTRFIGLGDYMDRGYYSLEYFITLLSFYKKEGFKIIMGGGNHDDSSLIKDYGTPTSSDPDAVVMAPGGSSIKAFSSYLPPANHPFYEALVTTLSEICKQLVTHVYVLSKENNEVCNTHLVHGASRHMDTAEQLKREHRGLTYFLIAIGALESYTDEDTSKWNNRLATTSNSLSRRNLFNLSPEPSNPSSVSSLLASSNFEPAKLSLIPSPLGLPTEPAISLSASELSSLLSGSGKATGRGRGKNTGLRTHRELKDKVKTKQTITGHLHITHEDAIGSIVSSSLIHPLFPSDPHDPKTTCFSFAFCPEGLNNAKFQTVKVNVQKLFQDVAKEEKLPELLAKGPSHYGSNWINYPNREKRKQFDRALSIELFNRVQAELSDIASKNVVAQNVPVPEGNLQDPTSSSTTPTPEKPNTIVHQAPPKSGANTHNPNGLFSKPTTKEPQWLLDWCKKNDVTIEEWKNWLQKNGMKLVSVSRTERMNLFLQQRAETQNTEKEDHVKVDSIS